MLQLKAIFCVSCLVMSLPLLYSFRRCPYAIRARLGILFAKQRVELREVVLKHKPESMLAISPKGTVPVLQLVSGEVIDESRDIMMWALEANDPLGLLNSRHMREANILIDENDDQFKYWLDRYKYADRYPAMTQDDYRQEGEKFLKRLDCRLTSHAYLLSDDISAADIALAPFVRQFAHVDRDLFYRLPYPNLQQWLKRWLEHPLFFKAMTKYTPWQGGDVGVIFPAQ